MNGTEVAWIHLLSSRPMSLCEGLMLCLFLFTSKRGSIVTMTERMRVLVLLRTKSRCSIRDKRMQTFRAAYGACQRQGRLGPICVEYAYACNILILKQTQIVIVFVLSNAVHITFDRDHRIQQAMTVDVRKYHALEVSFRYGPMFLFRQAVVDFSPNLARI